MQSNIYPNIIFQENLEQKFVSEIESLQEKTFKPLKINDPRTQTFVRSVAKIFNEIEVSEQFLWVFSAHSSIRVYFSEPMIYPMSVCCQKSVFVEFYQESLNGSITCPLCKTKLSKFIYSQSRKTQAEDLEEATDQQTFKEEQKKISLKQNYLRNAFSANKFRTTNLKKVFQSPNKPFPFVDDSGHFILQIKKEKGLLEKQKRQQHVENNFLTEPQKENRSPKQHKLQQTKEFIEEIFS